MILRSPRALLLALGICAALGACSRDAILRRLATPETERFAREFIRDLRSGDTAATGRRLSPRLLQIPGVRDSIAGLAKFFPRGPVKAIELTGAQVHMEMINAQLTSRSLEYQEESAGGWAVIRLLVLEDEGGYRYVDAVQVGPIPAPANPFTLAGKDPRHWVMLVLAAGVPLICLGIAVLVVLRRRRRSRAEAREPPAGPAAPPPV